MAIMTQHSARPAADGPDRPVTSQAGPASPTGIPLMGPADPDTVTPLMGPADPGTVTPLMGPLRVPARSRRPIDGLGFLKAQSAGSCRTTWEDWFGTSARARQA
jgi:hypothetical protein